MNIKYEEIGVFDSKKAAKALLELTDKVMAVRAATDGKCMNLSSETAYPHKEKSGETKNKK